MLETSFLVTLLRPHFHNFSKRLVKSPKLYFLDTGFLCYLLRIRSPEELRIHSSRGSIFESFVLAELLKNYFHRREDPDLYFWRDSRGHEIDILIDQGDVLVPVEVKSSQTFNAAFLQEIQYWKKLAGVSGGPAAVVYGGNASFRRSSVAVYSWAIL